MTTQTLEEVLSHYGVPGMKWGVRKARGSASSSSGRGKKKGLEKREGEDADGKPTLVVRNRASNRSAEVAKDEIRKVELLTRAGEFSTATLTNKDLQDVITRMNLEQSYAKLNPPQKSMGKKGQEFALQLVKDVGKQQVTKLANDQASKAIAKMLVKQAVKP